MRSSSFPIAHTTPHIAATCAATTVTHALPLQVRFNIDVQDSSFLAVRAHSQMLRPLQTGSRTYLPHAQQQPYILALPSWAFMGTKGWKTDLEDMARCIDASMGFRTRRISSCQTANLPWKKRKSEEIYSTKENDAIQDNPDNVAAHSCPKSVVVSPCSPRKASEAVKVWFSDSDSGGDLEPTMTQELALPSNLYRSLF
ncbi:hypothetical protein HYDPIDRAFT_32450 [Hydnomerulius pinastri MD-312]|uniref:Uncharacterized protein n=1 Tax=Hydnomerulius pinastri MD-312 TaxID=994086 RepID=A0A0C9W2K1_9AGAM|nr:hypothetical protein HYDPIDRAFT_32450 [Hydnomerulius pinastri MD-312]